jgi:signal peptidase I
MGSSFYYLCCTLCSACRYLLNHQYSREECHGIKIIMGRLIVPAEGSVIQLSTANIEQWRTIINREFGREVVSIRNNSVLIDGNPVESYTFKKDYYFMMGDNRDDSADSRYWGFVPRDMVVGEAFITLFSWDRDIPFSDLFRLLGSIRLDRVLKLIN